MGQKARAHRAETSPVDDTPRKRESFRRISHVPWPTPKSPHSHNLRPGHKARCGRNRSQVIASALPPQRPTAIVLTRLTARWLAFGVAEAQTPLRERLSRHLLSRFLRIRGGRLLSLSAARSRRVGYTNIVSRLSPNAKDFLSLLAKMRIVHVSFPHARLLFHRPMRAPASPCASEPAFARPDRPCRSERGRCWWPCSTSRPA